MRKRRKPAAPASCAQRRKPAAPAELRAAQETYYNVYGTLYESLRSYKS